MLHWGMKRRLDEDLERIKNANLPADEPLEEIGSEQEDLKLEPLDYPALIIAFLLSVLPYAAIFIGSICAASALMYLWLK